MTCQECMNYKPANDGDCQNEKEQTQPFYEIRLTEKQASFLLNHLENDAYFKGFSTDKKMIKIINKLKDVLE